MNQVISVGPQESFLVAICVLFLGQFVNAKLPILKKFNIPEPIVGGLIVACAITAMHFNGVDLVFDLPLQNTFMLMFFATVGLAANYTQLIKGGAKVFIFLAVASVYILIQNAVGVSLATALGLDPLMGLIAGSITLSGGHGTGAAWSQTFQDMYGLHNVLEVAMASATFGLVIGGIIGSPVAQRLIDKRNLESEYGRTNQTHEQRARRRPRNRKESGRELVDHPAVCHWCWLLRRLGEQLRHQMVDDSGLCLCTVYRCGDHQHHGSDQSTQSGCRDGRYSWYGFAVSVPSDGANEPKTVEHLRLSNPVPYHSCGAIGDFGGFCLLRDVPCDGQQLRCSGYRKWSLWLWSGRNPNGSNEHGLYR